MSSKDELNDILKTQQSIYKDMVTILFETVSKRLDEQYGIINDLKQSLEFSQKDISELKSENLQSQKKLNENEKIISDQAQAIESLQKQIARQEDFTRRKNIRVDGMQESPKENPEQTQVKIHKILAEKMELKDLKIDVAHRISRPNNYQNSSVREPRTVIVRFSSVEEKELTLKNAFKLKNTGIFLNEDLSDTTMKSRNSKLPELRAAKQSGKIAYFRKDRLIIHERQPKVLQTHSGSFTPPRPVSTLIRAFDNTPTPDNPTLEISPDTAINTSPVAAVASETRTLRERVNSVNSVKGKQKNKDKK